MKIKKVVIEGFRAYQTERDGTFDFSAPDGSCSNFVSIYAPNGFGKTSFYDAVEWVLTNNIERFVRDSTRVGNDLLSKSRNHERKRQHILRNRTIDDTAPARVTVVCDSFEKQKDVPKAKVGSRDFLFTREQPDKGMEQLPDVFLSQDAIDAFLREERPEARYTRFMQHFGDSDEAYRANLTALKRELANMLKATAQEQQRLEGIIGIPVNERIFDNINATIQKLNDAGESLPLISEKFDVDEERKLRNTITQRAHELSNLIADLNKFVAKIELATAELPNMASTINSRLATEDIIVKLQDRRSILTNYLQLINDVRTLSEAIEHEQEIGNHWKSLLEKSPTFENKRQMLGESEKIREACQQRLLELHASREILDKRASECKQKLAEITASTNALIEIQKNSTSVYLEIETIEGDIRKKHTILKDRQDQMHALSSKIGLERKRLQVLEALEINEKSFDKVDLTPLLNQDISPLELHAALSQKRSCEEQLIAASRVIDTLATRRDELSSLIALGSSLLSESRSKQCPLCAHEHPSHEVLMHRVEHHDALSELESTALHSKLIAQRAFDESAKNVALLIAQWQEIKTDVTFNLRSSVLTDEANLRGLTAQLQQLEIELTTDMSRLDRARHSVLNLTRDQLAHHLEKEFSLLGLRHASEESDRLKSESLSDQCLQEIKAETQKLEELESQIRLARESALYSEIALLCSTNGVELENAGRLLSLKLDSSLQRIADLVRRLKESQVELSTVELQYPNLRNEQLEQIDIELAQAQAARLSTEAALAAFFANIASLVPHYQPSWAPEQIAVAIRSTSRRIRLELDVRTEIARSFKLLGDQVSDVLPYVVSLSAHEQLRMLEIKRDKQKALDAAIDTEYQKTIERLQARIKGFFYTDLINSIYKKIDPHPDFKAVRFECDFSDGEKPRLHVLVSDEAGDIIAPNLYFSAAQVNILSLSIFLARALHVKANGKEVGCIFIDDPIHSMDSINVLSTIDLLRAISKKFNRQIILSTHDRNFFELLKKKIPQHEYSSKFIELESFGRVYTG